MKSIATILFFLNSVFAFSQTTKIIKILNKEIGKEITAQKDTVNYFGEKFDVIKNFSLENNVLSITLKRKSYYGEDFYNEIRQVELCKIKRIVKDINIIFETEPNAVKITQINAHGEKSEKTTDMFFLQMSSEKQNEYVADDLLVAFRKAGYTIEKGFWYD